MTDCTLQSGRYLFLEFFFATRRIFATFVARLIVYTYDKTKLVNLRETSVSFFVLSVETFVAGRSTGALAARPLAAWLPPPEELERGDS